MHIVKPRGTATVEDLLRMPEDGQKHELVDGEIVVSPTGYRHSRITIKIVHIIETFLDEHPIGEVCSSDLGIWLANRNLRSPDVTFVLNEKVPEGKAAQSFAEFVPDLAVEVLSPNDRLAFVTRKIEEFLENGVPLVWLVDPDEETVTVYRPAATPVVYSCDDTIDAEPILPGFSCLVSRFF